MAGFFYIKNRMERGNGQTDTEFADLLFSWYDANKRVFPFRGTRDPYRIWLSEIMLQQTRTETVCDYYVRFIALFPDVFALAAADEQKVLKAWEGLGYYSRARNLHAAAKVIAARGGVFPDTAEKMRSLPGIGAYTAAAVASIAFDERVPAMDGNLIRVFSRITDEQGQTDAQDVLARLRTAALERMPYVRCGDFNQALMDLGATVCVPGTPSCGVCPLKTLCAAFRRGDAEELPHRAKAAPQKVLRYDVMIAVDHGRVLIEQRREKLLQGLWVFPMAEAGAGIEMLEKRGLTVNEADFRAQARHVFTHRIWEMRIWVCTVTGDDPPGVWADLRHLERYPFPTAMKRALEEAVRTLERAAR